jgi:hypothetical protein
MKCDANIERTTMKSLFVLGLTGLLFAQATSAMGQVATGAYGYFSETSKDFGVTPRGPVLVHYFALKNNSGTNVTIGQPRVSCGCVRAEILKSQLAAEESTVVAAYMDTRRIPQANVVKSVTIYVPFYSPQTEEVQLRVQAIARDDLVISPDSLAFGTLKQGQTGKATTKLTFYSDSNWRITEATSTGAYIKVNATPGSRQGNEVSYEIVATLDPTCPVGNWTADVWLKTTTPGLDRVRIPVTVNVVSPISIKPDQIDFGQATIGKLVEQKVILQANEPFDIKDIKTTTPGLEVTPVAKGARPVHILKMQFTPASSGKMKSAFEVLTDLAIQPKVTIPWSVNAIEASK